LSPRQAISFSLSEQRVIGSDRLQIVGILILEFERTAVSLKELSQLMGHARAGDGTCQRFEQALAEGKCPTELNVTEMR